MEKRKRNNIIVLLARNKLNSIENIIAKALIDNMGLVSSVASLTSSGEGTSLALVGTPSSDGVTIKIPYGVDVLLHRPPSHPIFSY